MIKRIANESTTAQVLKKRVYVDANGVHVIKKVMRNGSQIWPTNEDVFIVSPAMVNFDAEGGTTVVSVKSTVNDWIVVE